jgi:hypothetical protein
MLTLELIPGDAVALMLGEHATGEAVVNLIVDLSYGAVDPRVSRQG